MTMATVNKRRSTVTSFALWGGVLGALIGMPLSYFFQPGMVRLILSMPQYLQKIFVMIHTALFQSQGPVGVHADDQMMFSTFKATVLAMMVLGVIGGIVAASIKRQRPSELHEGGQAAE